MSTTLIEFVKDASRLGKSRTEIHAALLAAGWPEEQLATFWKHYHDMPFPVPVPKPTLYASPRLTTLNLFYFVVLYLTIYSAIDILFTILDSSLPDGRGNMRGFYYSTGPLLGEIRWSLAAIITCVPMVYVTSRALQKGMRASGQFIPVIRLKLMNLTLFVAGLITLGNIIGCVYYLLSGELGLRFVIKVVILSAISLSTYLYFKPEMASFEKKA